MANWVRFSSGDQIGFGTLDDETILVHEGDMFHGATPNGARVELSDVALQTPCVPSKMIGLWNNSHALADKLGAARPDEPLYFQKSSNSYLESGGIIHRPAAYSGRVVFEGELGIVIGTLCKDVSEKDAPNIIFGYTCVNDVTAFDIIDKDPTFAQWCRAKSFDTFAPFGPCIAAGLDPANLHVRTVLNGDERQHYPVADMIIPPLKIVSILSREMTLFPGDIICCGTSVGAGSMKEDQNTVSVTIDGIGTLENLFVNA